MLRCSVRPDAAGVVSVELRRGDPLARPLPARPIPTQVDLAALCLGVREDGAPWTLSLDDGHLLVVGGAGSGTGSVVWSLARAMAVPVRDGSVELWGVDGTGGLGLGAGEPMFTRLALGGPAEGAALFDAVLAVLHQRVGLRRTTGVAGPVDAGPLVVLVLHELVRWGPALDDAQRQRLVAALELLLAYGEAAGIVVVATTPLEDAELAAQFSQKVVLRPTGMSRLDPPGVGLASSGTAAPVRVRAPSLDDDEITAMAAAYTAPVRTVRARRPRGPSGPARSAESGRHRAFPDDLALEA
jgi:S-DNA-T family DNA segregation ATPase FtsK/SpoIIIE